MNVVCQYCGRPAVLVTGQIIYGSSVRHLWGNKFWHCAPCKAYVGTHRSGKPLGILSNHEGRLRKMQAHKAFDPIWKTGVMSRDGAYKWLANALGLSKDECHIGMFNEERCLRVVELATELLAAKAEEVQRNKTITAIKNLRLYAFGKGRSSLSDEQFEALRVALVCIEESIKK